MFGTGHGWSLVCCLACFSGALYLFEAAGGKNAKGGFAPVSLTTESALALSR